MSADNFVVIREFPDGFRWGNFSASYWWGRNEPYPDSKFNSRAFPTRTEARDSAQRELMIIEYGFESDRTPPDEVDEAT